MALSAANLKLLASAWLIAFAACQIPLDLLDRFGPRRAEGGLLLVAAPAHCSSPSATRRSS